MKFVSRPPSICAFIMYKVAALHTWQTAPPLKQQLKALMDGIDREGKQSVARWRWRKASSVLMERLETAPRRSFYHTLVPVWLVGAVLRGTVGSSVCDTTASLRKRAAGMFVYTKVECLCVCVCLWKCKIASQLCPPLIMCSRFPWKRRIPDQYHVLLVWHQQPPHGSARDVSLIYVCATSV